MPPRLYASLRHRGASCRSCPAREAPPEHERRSSAATFRCNAFRAQEQAIRSHDTTTMYAAAPTPRLCREDCQATDSRRCSTLQRSAMISSAPFFADDDNVKGKCAADAFPTSPIADPRATCVTTRRRISSNRSARDRKETSTHDIDCHHRLFSSRQDAAATLRCWKIWRYTA